MCNILLHSEPVLRHSDNRVPGHHQREVSKYYDMYNKIVTNSVKILEQNIVRVWRVMRSHCRNVKQWRTPSSGKRNSSTEPPVNTVC